MKIKYQVIEPDKIKKIFREKDPSGTNIIALAMCASKNHSINAPCLMTKQTEVTVMSVDIAELAGGGN
ncbi:MAG: hypothetical protein R2741_03070 [Methanolobus sp.]